MRESSASARPRLRSPSSVRGGKNSNENDGSAPSASRSSIRIARSLGSRALPASPGSPLDGQRPLLQVRQAARVLLSSQFGRGLVELLAVDGLGELERVAARPRAPPDGGQALGDERAVGRRCAPATSVNGRPWPDSASRASSASTLSSELEELADRVGRVAGVEVQRDAPEQVVAGDQQPALGLVQADVRRARGRASRSPASRRGRSRRSRPRSARGRRASVPAWPVPWLRRCSTQRCSGASGTPLWRAISSRRASACSRSPAAPCGARGSGASTPRSRRARRSAAPARSGRRARACRRSAARARSAGRPGRARARGAPSSPARACRCRRARSRRPAASAHALQCGTPGHGSGSRSRHTPGRTFSPRPTSRLRVGLRTARDGNVAARMQAADARRRSSTDVLRRARPPRRRGDGGAVGAGRAGAHRGPGRRRRPGGRARVLHASCSPRSRTSR